MSRSIFIHRSVTIIFALLLLVTPFLLFAQNTQAPPTQDDEFNLFLFTILVVGIAVMIGAAIIGAFFAAFVIFCLLGLVSAGILSTSILVGLYKRSLAAGFKTFLIIICSIGGAVFGMIGLFVISSIFHLHLRHSTSLITGAVSGLLGGILLGISLSIIIRTLFAHFRNKLFAA